MYVFLLFREGEFSLRRLSLIFKMAGKNSYIKFQEIIINRRFQFSTLFNREKMFLYTITIYSMFEKKNIFAFLFLTLYINSLNPLRGQLVHGP